MSIVNIRVRCSDAFSELLIEDREQTELIIESIVSTALLEVFDNVEVENVMISHPTNILERHVSVAREKLDM